MKNAYKNLVLIGFMGTFKTSAGKIAAETLSRHFVDTDAYLEYESGKSVAGLFKEYGEADFREREAKAVRRLASFEGIVLATGGGVPLMAENISALKENGFIILLTAPAEEIYARTGSGGRPLLEGGDRLKTIQKLLKEREPYYLTAADAVISTAGKTPEITAAEAVRAFLGDSTAERG